jgi:hypothetical protein
MFPNENCFCIGPINKILGQTSTDLNFWNPQWILYHFPNHFFCGAMNLIFGHVFFGYLLGKRARPIASISQWCPSLRASPPHLGAWAENWSHEGVIIQPH